MKKTGLGHFPAPRTELAAAADVQRVPPPPDEELLECLWRGDVHGLAGLYDRHGPDCLRTALEELRGVEAAETLVFQVFLMTWREPPDCGVSVRQFLIDRTLELAPHFHA